MNRQYRDHPSIDRNISQQRCSRVAFPLATSHRLLGGTDDGHQFPKAQSTSNSLRYTTGGERERRCSRTLTALSANSKNKKRKKKKIGMLLDSAAKVTSTPEWHRKRPSLRHSTQSSVFMSRGGMVEHKGGAAFCFSPASLSNNIAKKSRDGWCGLHRGVLNSVPR